MSINHGEYPIRPGEHKVRCDFVLGNFGGALWIGVKLARCGDRPARPMRQIFDTSTEEPHAMTICGNPNHRDKIEKLDGTIVCGHCEPALTWDGPFHAILFNEADEPHAEIELKVCTETITRAGLIYRLTEFEYSGATYRFLKFDPAGPYGKKS